MTTAEEVYTFLKGYKINFEGRKYYKNYSLEKVPYKNVIYTITSLINSSALKYSDFKNYFVYKYIWLGEFDLKNIKYYDIKKTNQMFSKERLKYELDYLKTICDSMDITIEEMFRVNTVTFIPPIFSLLKKGSITLPTYLYLFNFFIQNPGDLLEKNFYLFTKRIIKLRKKGII